MKINSYNEWDKLNEVVIGKGLMMKTNLLETSFKLFYGDHLTESDSLKSQVNAQFIEEHCEDVENYVSLLESHNIKVYRPETYDKLIPIKTPNFSTQTHLTGPLNVRDLVAIFGNTIVEFPPEIRSRYFETENMKNIFNKAITSGSMWISLPKPAMPENAYTNGIIEPQLDAARCMRFNDNIIVNVNNANNKFALQLLKNNFPEYIFHEVNWVDGHIDSCIMPLREGVLVVNKVFLPKPKEQLPDFCKDWDLIECEYHEEYNADIYAGNDVMLASNNIDCNVLSINPNQLICHDYAVKYLQPLLKKYKIECIPCQMRHSRLMDGGFHCHSLDLNRG